MIRTASTYLAQRRLYNNLSPSPSSSLSFLNHRTLSQRNCDAYQNSTTGLISSSNHTTRTGHKSNNSYNLLNDLEMVYNHPIVWRSQVNQLRLLSTSTKSKVNELETKGNADSGNKGQNEGSVGSNDTKDNLIFGLDRKRLLIGMGIFSVGSAIIALPVATRYTHQVEQEYEEDEVEIDDDLYQRIKDISAEVEGEITQRLLGEELSKKLAEGAKQKAIDNTVSLFTDVINSEALQNAITTLLSNIVTSSQFKGACQMLLKNLWDDLINDPETTAQVIALLNTAIQDEKIKTSFKELILGLLRDEEVKQELTRLVVQLGEEQEVLDATRELLTESAHRALNDPEILDHSMEFATDVVGDNVLQRTSGEALRNTVTYAVKPSLSTFLSVFGVALLIFSASALGRARISAREGREIDAAVSLVAKSIGNNFLSKLGKILSIPVNAVSGFTSAIVATLLFPFQMVGKAAGAIGSAGNSALYTIFDAFSKASSFPGFIQEIVSLSLSSIKLSISSLSQQTCLMIASVPGIIISKTKMCLTASIIFIQNGLKSGGAKAYSSAMSMFVASGMKLSNMLNSLIQKSRSSLDNAGKQILLGLSDTLTLLLSIFRGTSSQ